MFFPYREITLALAAATLTSCEREKREFQPPVEAAPGQAIQLTSVQAGGGSQVAKASFRYDENAYALAQGQQLFSDFNCGTCHASHGGGDIGPPLLDEKWIYGSEPRQIYASIVE